MGFYDCRCMVSGVSLKGADAAAVLLRKAGREQRPIALALKGNYDRLGSIDGLEETANSRLILAYFQRKVEDGGLAINKGYWEVADRYPITDTERLLWGFERNMNDSPDTAVFYGRPITFALISCAVWDALARAAPAAQFGKLFDGVAIAAEIYGGHEDEVAQEVRELAAVEAFLAKNDIKWKPTKADGQHYEETRRFLLSARRKFPTGSVADGLKAYAHEIAELLEEDEEEE